LKRAIVWVAFLVLLVSMGIWYSRRGSLEKEREPAEALTEQAALEGVDPAEAPVVGNAHLAETSPDVGGTAPVDATPRETCQLTLTLVVGEEEQPVAGIEVLAFREIGTKQTSDAAGEVHFTLEPREWRFQIQDNAYGRQSFTIDLTGETSFEMTVPLSEGGTLVGSVVDREGVPLGGVELVVAYGNERINVVASEVGEWWLSDLPLHETFTIRVGKNPLLKRISEIRFAHGSRERRVDIALDLAAEEYRARQSERLIRVEVSVTDPSGQPVDGAVLSSGSDGGATTFGITDRSGRAETVLRIPAGYQSTSIRVSKEGWVTTRSPGIISSPAEQRLEVVLRRGVMVHGRVVTEDEVPIPEVQVFVGELRTRTDAAGAFRVGPVAPDALLVAGKVGYRGVQLPLEGLDLEQEIRVVLMRPSKLIGRVVDSETGEPISRFSYGCKIFQTFSDGGRGWNGRHGEVDNPEGLFEIGDLEDMTAELTLHAEGYAPGRFEQVLPSEEVQTFALKPGGLVVAGRVTDESGRGIAGFQLKLATSADDPFGRMGHRLWSDQPAAHAVTRTLTDERGSFRFENLAEEVAYLLLGYMPGLAPVFITEVTARDDREALSLELAPGSTLVLEINRERYPDINQAAFQTVNRHNLFEPLAVTEERFEIEGLYAGDWTVRLSSKTPTSVKPGPQDRITLEPGEHGRLRFGFDPVFALSGFALHEDGRAPTGRTLVVKRGTETRMTTLGEDGSFRITGLPSGTYGLMLTGDPRHPVSEAVVFHRLYARSVEIGEEDVSGVFHFERRGDVTGRLVTREEVGLYLVLGSEQVSARTLPLSPSGHFLLPALPPDEYRLSLKGFLEGDLLLLRRFQMMGADLDLGEIVPESFAYLEVARIDQSPLALIEMRSLEDVDARRGPSSGSYVLPRQPKRVRVPAGRSRFGFMAGHRGYRAVPAVLDVDLVPGETLEVQIDLEPITRLVIACPTTEDLSRVVITGEAGTSVTVAPRLMRSRPIADGQPLIWCGYEAVFFEGLPPDTYRIELHFEAGEIVKNTALMLGTPVELKIEELP